MPRVYLSISLNLGAGVGAGVGAAAGGWGWGLTCSMGASSPSGNAWSPTSCNKYAWNTSEWHAAVKEGEGEGVKR